MSVERDRRGNGWIARWREQGGQRSRRCFERMLIENQCAHQSAFNSGSSSSLQADIRDAIVGGRLQSAEPPHSDRTSGHPNRCARHLIWRPSAAASATRNWRRARLTARARSSPAFVLSQASCPVHRRWSNRSRPSAIVTAGHDNKAARMISYEGEPIDEPAGTAMLEQIIANNPRRRMVQAQGAIGNAGSRSTRPSVDRLTAAG